MLYFTRQIKYKEKKRKESKAGSDLLIILLRSSRKGTDFPYLKTLELETSGLTFAHTFIDGFDIGFPNFTVKKLIAFQAALHVFFLLAGFKCIFFLFKRDLPLIQYGFMH